MSGCRADPDLAQGEPLFAEVTQNNPETRSVCISFVNALLLRDPSQPFPHVQSPASVQEKRPTRGQRCPLQRPCLRFGWRQKGKAPGLGPSSEGRENQTGAALQVQLTPFKSVSGHCCLSNKRESVCGDCLTQKTLPQTAFPGEQKGREGGPEPWLSCVKAGDRGRWAE